jgi:hypothetical protein
MAIIAIVAAIGFTMAACPVEPDGRGSDKPRDITYSKDLIVLDARVLKKTRQL